MSEKENLGQEVVDDLLTDPDKDAATSVPPQTIADEPSGDGADAHGRYSPTGRSEDGGR